MPGTDSIFVKTDSTGVRSRRPLRRIIVGCIVVLAVLGLVLLPPLINVNRFQRRIATSISESLGRPVHLDNVTMSLLPFPGFTLERLVVDEDPAFGSEPIIRADSVRATLRLSSLWRKRVEFSSISFTEPTSVNLVHMPDGKWNIESILIQAAHITAAPTGQPTAGPAPRFPYIEATGARVNLKWGQDKTPFSLTDADFALWLSDPQQWKIRLVAQPVRTDTSVSDTGTVRLEGTLGRAASLSEVPLHLQAQWRSAPLARPAVSSSAAMQASAEKCPWRRTSMARWERTPSRPVSTSTPCAAPTLFQAAPCRSISHATATRPGPFTHFRMCAAVGLRQATPTRKPSS